MTEPLHRPLIWEYILNVTVIDPDGWRQDGKSYDEPITRAEFVERMLYSTVRTEPHPSYDDNYRRGRGPKGEAVVDVNIPELYSVQPADHGEP